MRTGFRFPPLSVGLSAVHCLLSTVVIGIQTPGVYSSGRGWSKSSTFVLSLFVSGVDRGQHAAVVLVACFECDDTPFDQFSNLGISKQHGLRHLHSSLFKHTNICFVCRQTLMISILNMFSFEAMPYFWDFYATKLQLLPTPFFRYCSRLCTHVLYEPAMPLPNFFGISFYGKLHHLRTKYLK